MHRSKRAFSFRNVLHCCELPQSLPVGRVSLFGGLPTACVLRQPSQTLHHVMRGRDTVQNKRTAIHLTVQTPGCLQSQSSRRGSRFCLPCHALIIIPTAPLLSAGCQHQRQRLLRCSRHNILRGHPGKCRIRCDATAAVRTGAANSRSIACEGTVH